MRHALLKTGFAVLVLMVASIAHAAPPGLPDLSTFPNSLGVNIHFTDPKPGEMEQIYAAGFRWVRMDFQWEAIEHAKGEYDFSACDRLIASLDQHHMHAIFILDYGNRHYDNGLSPHSDEGRSAFAKWAAASVHHFKGHGVFWEMWNEPNGSFWKPTRNVDDYIKLALVVGKAIAEVEPDEIYIGPATSTIDMPFLEACFKAGCLEYWSAVSVHPYRQSDPETVADEYRKLRQLIAKYAPKGRQIPIISGEWGYSSVWKNFDEERQAKYLPREMLTNMANDVPLSIWYDWHEDGKDPKEPEHHFGIAKPDVVNKDGNLYEPKKAYLAACQMSDAIDGFRFNKRLAIGGSDYYVLLFDNPLGKTRLVSWTPADSKLELPLPIVNGAVTKHLPDHADVNLPANAKGIRLTPDDFPTYVIPDGREDLLRVAAAWTRVPQEVAAAGPAKVNVETTLSNPLDHPLKVRVAGRETIVNPGQSMPVISEEQVTRSPETLPVVLIVDIEGLGRIAQRTSITVTNPLEAIVFPRVGNTQQVVIENPAGDALHASATLSGAQDVMCEGKQGETEARLSFVFHKKDSRFDEKRLMLLNADNQTLLDIPRAENFDYFPLKDFSHAEMPCFETNLVADGDTKVTSEQKLSYIAPPTGPPAPDADSAKIEYRFEKGWKFIRLAPAYSQKYRNVAKLGLWVYGDASGNIARMRFTDSTGQTFQPDGGRIIWKGWRYIEFPMTGRDTAQWGGAHDGTVHDPVKIDSLFLLDSPNREATHGEIYLSTPTLIYDK